MKRDSASPVSNSENAESLRDAAARLAYTLCTAFIRHDQARYGEAAGCFAEVNIALFPELRDSARNAAQHFTNALRIKDAIDLADDRKIRFADPRWAEVYVEFLKYCSALHVPIDYAYHATEFWRHHKGERDYWTHCLAAERIVAERLLGDSSWTTKKSDGRNGFGILPALYLVGVEAHDLHSDAAWDMAQRAMALYFEIILAKVTIE